MNQQRLAELFLCAPEPYAQMIPRLGSLPKSVLERPNNSQPRHGGNQEADCNDQQQALRVERLGGMSRRSVPCAMQWSSTWPATLAPLHDACSANIAHIHTHASTC